MNSLCLFVLIRYVLNMDATDGAKCGVQKVQELTQHSFKF